MFNGLDIDLETLGVIVIDHGSRREESNAMLLEVVAMFEQAAPYKIVEPAHMELAEPSLSTAFGRCVERGAKLVIVFPYFLLPGRHWKQDIPALAEEASRLHNNVRYLVTAPLGLHPLMAQIMQQRIGRCLETAHGKADGCDICAKNQSNRHTPCAVRTSADPEAK